MCVGHAGQDECFKYEVGSSNKYLSPYKYSGMLKYWLFNVINVCIETKGDLCKSIIIVIQPILDSWSVIGETIAAGWVMISL